MFKVKFIGTENLFFIVLARLYLWVKAFENEFLIVQLIIFLLRSVFNAGQIVTSVRIKEV